MRAESSIHLIMRVSIVVLLFSLKMFVYSTLLNAQDIDYQTRTFVDASSNNFPPMNTLDDDGNLTGFGRELSDAVIKVIDGKVIHIHSNHWAQVLEWLNTGKADFIHDVGYTKDRDKFLDYSDPIIEMPEVIFVRPDQYDITDFNSLKGKTVACVNKHISHLYLQLFPEINCYIVKTPVEGLYELITGKVDAFVYPKQIVLYLAQNLRFEDKIKITGEPLRTLTWSMVVKEGNKEFLQLLNEGISKVRETGEYDRIYNKWWGKKLLSGYSKRELFFITSIITGTSLAVILLTTLFIFNRILTRDKKVLKAESALRNKVEKELKMYSKRLEEMVEERTKELQEVHEQLLNKEKLAAIGQLASGVGHELRNPIGVIGNSVYYLNMKLKDIDEKTKRHLDILQREVLRSNTIITDLLDFSRVKPPAFEEADLNNIIKETMTGTEVPENITLETKLDEKLPRISVDADQIRRVIMNIASNVFWAMPEGGKLTIKTVVKKDFVEIMFKDTGEGISEENLQKIFEPLFTTKAKGIGLGLAIVKGIVDNHKGGIEVESEVGKGTTFTVKLPLQVQKEKGNEK